MIFKAVIADDEAELRTHLKSMLSEIWPELIVAGEAQNGEEAVALVESKHPHVAFLDIRMPGFSGMEAARRIAGRCRIVFITAYDQYAVEAFEKNAIDYLLKPVSKERLVRTVERLKTDLGSSPAPPDELAVFIQEVLSRLPEGGSPGYLRWIRVQEKNSIRLIPVEEAEYFKAEDKYTLVVTKEQESLVRKTIKELAEELDPAQFWQIHRGIIVNVSRIDKVSRSLTGRGMLKLKERPEVLTVSRNYLHLFKQM